jgi:cyclophilin family peptidyl-prolyl cis-trans isomerase/HEAT repeat protein
VLVVALALLLQGPTEYEVLRTEHARPADISVLAAGLRSPSSRVRLVAIRAIGRLERPVLADLVAPLTRDADPAVRRASITALAQMGSSFGFAELVSGEKDAGVRAALYESIGRIRPPAAGSEEMLVRALADPDLVARTSAARGLESLIRATIRTMKPQPATIEALRGVTRESPSGPIRQFGLLALNAAGDRDIPTLDAAFQDPDPQIRRLAVLGGKRWTDDTSPIVRVEAVRLAGDCDRARRAVDDPSGHVALAAIDLLGTQKCDAALIDGLAATHPSWRFRARALVALAKTDPVKARARIATMRSDPRFQVRVYAAQAARSVEDTASLALLASDKDPNVASAALTSTAEAVCALASDHAGLLLSAAAQFKKSGDLAGSEGAIVDTILRLTATARATVRDPRIKLLEVLDVAKETKALERLKPLIGDRDPVVATVASNLLAKRAGILIEPITKAYSPDPFPSEAEWKGLRGLTAEFKMREAGSFRIELLSGDAPATVATFVQLAKRRAYDGLTFHRVVPNFVLQGGSPGADEYDGLTGPFMRDEVGGANLRGTLGISTRGRDTGDGQVFINLVDNWRLDHTYTVFARVTSGMDAVDRILEGDVIERIAIVRP